MKAVSPNLPCSRNMYVENNRQLQCFHVCLQLECTVVLLRYPREAVLDMLCWVWGNSVAHTEDVVNGVTCPERKVLPWKEDGS